DITEEVMLKMTAFAHRETGLRDLCLAGGVALNCVGNGRILREGAFEQIWIQPAAGDAGGAVGVAMSLWHRYLGKPRVSCEAAGTWERPRRAAERVDPAFAPSALRRTSPPKYADGMSGAFLGPRFNEAGIRSFLDVHGYPATRVDASALADLVAGYMADEKVVGLLQGVWNADRARSAAGRSSATRHRRR